MDTKEQSLSKEQIIFSQYPIPKAVAAMAVPTIISQLITVVYNLADTWFVGLRGDAAAVAAISLCLPVYNMMTAFSNLFGIGGASVLARALGAQRPERAQKAFFSAASGALCAAVGYSLILAFAARPLLMRIGGDADSIGYAMTYTWITVILGGVPTILSSALAHLVRATGRSRIASCGITLGAVLNMVLDPLFMFVWLPRGHEVAGAAIATALSNVVSLLFFLVFLFRHREDDVLTFRKPNEKPPVLKNIVQCGMPSFSLTGAAMFSNCFLNGMIATMGSSAAVAGIGITRKLDSVAYAVNQGITQGMLPIVSYCYASRQTDRMKKVIRFSAVCTMSFSVAWSLLSWFFAPEMIGLFIRDADTIFYGAQFLRVLCISVAIYPLLFVIITVFQAVGDSVKPFVLSLLHKGSLDIVLFFVIRHFFGVEHILWSSVIMDTIALIVSLLLYKNRFSQAKRIQET